MEKDIIKQIEKLVKNIKAEKIKIDRINKNMESIIKNLRG